MIVSAGPTVLLLTNDDASGTNTLGTSHSWLTRFMIDVRVGAHARLAALVDRGAQHDGHLDALPEDEPLQRVEVRPDLLGPSPAAEPMKLTR